MMVPGVVMGLNILGGSVFPRPINYLMVRAAGTANYEWTNAEPC